MPPYIPNLSKVASGIPLLDKGDYVFEVGEGKPFERKKDVTDKETGEDSEKISAGVVYALTVIDGESFVGKNIPFSVYVHTEGAYGMAKQFAMACLGYTQQTEEEFNSKHSDENEYIVDPENEALGALWASLAGTKVAATVDQKVNSQDKTQKQNQFRWRPV